VQRLREPHVIIVLVVLILAAFVAGVLVTFWQVHRHRPGEVPAAVRTGALGTWIAPSLTGASLSLQPGETVSVDGPSNAMSKPPSRVVWVDGEDEALVHLDSITARTVGTTLLMSIDLETDETGRAPVIVRFAMGGPDDPGGLHVVTDEVPHGPAALVSRWGAAVQAALWGGVVTLAAKHAAQKGAELVAVGVERGSVVFRTSA
jgi:hypothetical protein